MSMLISGATVIDGVADKPLEGMSIWIEAARIKAIGPRDELRSIRTDKVYDATGKYAIPGLMNANVHLLCDVRLENLARYTGRYEELIAEAAQIALKHGVTTVFDTWGPRRFLHAVREAINAGKTPGSRVFFAGNIVGFDGPISPDFFAKAADVASAAFAKRINAIWVENVGRHLMWLPPDRVASEVRSYIGKGIDFVKYGSNEHGASPGAFLAFSPRVQSAIVDEAHLAGITAQAHTHSVEGLRIAIDAGCDLIQHANITGPVPIPEDTLELFAKKGTGAVIFPYTERGLATLMQKFSERERNLWHAADTNTRSLIRSGAPLVLATDGSVFAPEAATDPKWGDALEGDAMGLFQLSTGHFYWLRAMEEKGCAPMDMLRAATRNIAIAYGKQSDLGTLEPGKIADMLVLDKNPLLAAENYRRIHMIIKDGQPVDPNALPVNPLLTKPMEPPPEEEASYVPCFVGSGGFPRCPMCI